MLPLTSQGLGQVLRADRRGALAWHKLLSASDALVPYQAPELDIVTYFPRRPTLSAVARASQDLFVSAGSGDPARQIHLATYGVSAEAMSKRHDITLDAAAGRILRSTVLKPESEHAIAEIHRRLEDLSRSGA